MCLIIDRATTRPTLPHAFLADVWTRNSDGWGMMHLHRGRVYVRKGLDFPGLLRAVSDAGDRPYWLHFRMATHGDVSLANTHPFDCGHGIFMMHNGIIGTSAYEDYMFPLTDEPSLADEFLIEPEQSDTAQFIAEIVRPLLDGAKNPIRFLHSKIFEELIEKYVGHSNRLTFLSPHGHVIINPDTWHVINRAYGLKGLRVSNTYAWKHALELDRKKHVKPSIARQDMESIGSSVSPPPCREGTR